MRITIFFLLILAIFSCSKESFTTSPDAQLRLEANTIHFDTVFSTRGSITQGFKLFNENSKGIHVSSVQLKGGANSPFKINVNGIAGPGVTNIDIAGDDSAYVFVSVTVNPTTGVLPFIIRDSIEVSYNGNKKLVQLEAYGQNAHFLRGRQIATNTVWNNDLPYVILDGLEILAGAKLTINKGCKVFVRADAPFIVRGSLEILGGASDNERVVFTGDRLDEPYINFPASWPGIYFLNTSQNNIINYALIKNAFQGLVVQGPNVNSNPKLQISQTIIDNAYDIGLLGLNTKITGQNLLISNCGKNMVLANGGDYQFTHCTVASFSNSFIRHKEPVLLLTNYLGTSPPNALAANFTNSIFWGDTASLVKKEIIVEVNGGISNVVFNNVLWNEKSKPANVTNVTNAISEYPQFDSINTVKNFYDFRLKDTSPAIDAGINTFVNLDLISKPRPVRLPDLGCYEKQ